MIEIPNLEFHAAHACNLYCAQCSHYSNFHAGGIVSVEEARVNFDPWRGRLAPKQIAILGGEPTLNPDLIQIIELARSAFPDSSGLFVKVHNDASIAPVGIKWRTKNGPDVATYYQRLLGLILTADCISMKPKHSD